MQKSEYSELNQAVEDFSLTLEQRIDYDKLTFLYMSLPFVMTGHFFSSLLFGALQYQVVDSSSITVWLSLSTIVISWRFYHYLKFKGLKEIYKLKQAQTWLHHYYIDVIATGAIWGFSALLLFPKDNFMGQIIVIIFIFAISFATISSLASKFNLLLLYISVTFAPLLFRLIIMDEPYVFNLIMIVLALVVLLFFVAKIFGSIINNSLSNHQYFVQIQHEHNTLKERFFSLFDRAPVGIFYYDEKLLLLDANTRFIKLHDIDKSSLIQKDLHQLKNQEIIDQLNTVFTDGTGHYRGPFTPLESKDKLYVEFSTVPLMDNSGKVNGGICILEDITEEVNAKDEMIRQAYYDILTNIPNRTLFMDRLARALLTSQDKHTRGAVIYIDIDNFKSFNDTLGHQNGDILLKQIAKRIGDLGRRENTVARLSGDDFVILVADLPYKMESAIELVMLIARSYKDQFLQPFSIGSKEYHISVSLGISFFPNAKESAYDVLKRAETAMYHAKKLGRNRIELHSESMDKEISAILDIENRLRAAIKQNEFELFFQPQVDIANDTIVSAEVLIRWRNSDGSYIMPKTFIPVAETSGLILPISEWIFEASIIQMLEWKERNNPLKIDRIAINISAIHFAQINFVAQISSIIAKYGINPAYLELELTESVALYSIEETIQKIEDLKKLGITFALDDFGTGYSSLAYLKRLPVDYVKIDQSFISDMMNDKDDKMITDTIVSVAQNFNLKVIAEGVENSRQLEYLKSIGCTIYQGFLQSEPVSAKAFEALLLEQE
ncbi:EAL domain-containing protein [Sulfurimonas sp. HSL3-7]|uniref:sensor domain-containing protein n=1 Tax=Sulfonitrofixus jiaomeiensis TaxID=3131938 RepID=UPI0031F8FBA1